MTRFVLRKRNVLGLCLLAFTCTVFAVTPKFWELFSQEDLIKGRMTGVSLSSDGRLMLAPRYESIFQTDQALILSMTTGPASNVYLGTGHEGLVFKVDPSGRGEKFFKAQEIDVFALACDSFGNLFVGSSPNGKVYKVSADGKSTEFFEPGDKYIWDLKFDRDGNLYVATGGKGLLYRVDPSGNATTIFDADDTHLMSLAFDLDGNIIAGSAPEGLVFRVSREGKAFVLLDTPLAEVRRVAVDRLGDLFVVALAQAGSVRMDTAESGISNPGVVDTLRTGTNSVVISDASVTTVATDEARLPLSLEGGARTSKSSQKSILYRITKSGTTEELWSSPSEMVFDLVVRDDGKILLGTGTRGRILVVEPHDNYTLLAESDSEQATRLLAIGSDILVSTSNMGSLYRLQPERARSGEYVSDIFDAGMPSAWGQISWNARLATGTSVEVFTRSGNTSVPNNTWSDWVGPHLRQEGEAIRSPLARYLQWKVVFKSGGATRKLISDEDVLDNLVIAYLEQNARPRVTSLEILPPGVSLQKTPILPSSTGTVTVTASPNGRGSISATTTSRLNRLTVPPRQVLSPGSQAFRWKATDPNDDDLVFEIYFKGESESDWKLLEKDIEDEFFTIDDNTMPDGVYTVKIIARDSPSNAYGRSLTGEMISRPFVINNTAPSIEAVGHEVKGQQVEISYRARGSASRIFSSEFSIDGGPWHFVFPKDGIADSREEEFSFSTPEVTAGEHLVALRVTDTVGNVGMFKLIVKIP